MTQPPDAIVAAAQASQKAWKVFASVSLAQWAIESGWGKHDLGCFNFFGMKAPCDPHGHPLTPYVDVRTREVHPDGESYYIVAHFRKFTSVVEAFDEHAKLLATKQCYAKARAAADPDAFADALVGVYATDPNYAKALKAVMHGSNFYQYDQEPG